MSVVLRIQNLSISFGGLKAVSGLDMDIQDGQIFGLIGPNGAGKTTVFNLLTGVYKADPGSRILLNENNLVGKASFEIARLGLARTFQNIRLFKDLSLLENLQVALDANPEFPHYRVWEGMRRKSLRTEFLKVKKAMSLLAIFDLKNKAQDKAGSLPYGDQRRLEIARAMATGAKLILLDEPAAGLNSGETKALIPILQDLVKEHHLSLLLIEHDMKLVMTTCDEIAVLDHGQKIAQGQPFQIQNNPAVIEAYLGAHCSSSGNTLDKK